MLLRHAKANGTWPGAGHSSCKVQLCLHPLPQYLPTDSVLCRDEPGPLADRQAKVGWEGGGGGGWMWGPCSTRTSSVGRRAAAPLPGF